MLFRSVLLHHEKCRPHAKLLAVEAARDGRTMLLKIEAAKLKIQIGYQIWMDDGTQSDDIPF